MVKPEKVLKTMEDIEALKKSSVVIQARDDFMLKEAPKSYYQFERDFKSLKNERGKLVKYLLNIAAADLKCIFKSDLETDMILHIFGAFMDEGEDFMKENQEYLADFAMALSAVKPFDLACEFMMDDEKELIKKFVF